MTARLLPPEEWHRLVGTEAWPLPQARETDAHVVVVEHDGEIVGCHVLLSILHAECLWVHPDHRGKSGVIRRLWPAVQRTAREVFGARAFVTFAVDDRIRGLIAHLGGTRIPGECFRVPLTESETCQQP